MRSVKHVALKTLDPVPLIDTKTNLFFVRLSSWGPLIAVDLRDSFRRSKWELLNDPWFEEEEF